MAKQMKVVLFKAVTQHELCERDCPTLQSPQDLLVRIEACSICGSDLHILSDPPGFEAEPGAIIGHEMVGEVLEVGDAVVGYAPGDRIVCDPNIPCGYCHACRSGHRNMCENLQIHGVDRQGFFAEYVSIPANSAFKIRPDLPSDVAVFAEPVNCVMSAVDKIRLLPGEQVIVFGAGPIGLYFISLLKANGAGKVIAVEKSAFRREYAQKMGADIVLDPDADDVAACVQTVTDGLGVDVAVDAVGVCIGDCLEHVARNGRVMLFGQNWDANELISQNAITRNEVQVFGSYIGPYTMPATVKLLESGLIDFTKMITHRITLDEFDEGLAAMRSGEALEVVIYPHGRSCTVF